MYLRRQRGFILIFTLWVLGVLTVLAVGLAAGIRQKIVLIEKLDERSRVRNLLEAAVKYSYIYVGNQLNLSSGAYTIAVKTNVHNNPNIFGQINLAEDHATISYTLPQEAEIFGVVDEERKINLNATTPAALARLIEKALSLKPDAAASLASDILDWRQIGSSQVVGFYSDAYYDNLRYPYRKKQADFENINELLLIKGVTKEIYKALIKYVTVYGDGKVNINTASPDVLFALGLEDTLIAKILQARQGQDAQDFTADDHIFLKTFDIASELNQIVKLDNSEIRAIDGLNQQNLLTTNSYYFSVEAQAYLAHSSFSKRIHAIISLRDERIVYWNER